MQADGNGSGDYMHSGMRGGPHVGAFRRCSFTETESYSKWNPRASSVIHLLVSSQQVLMVIHFPSVLQAIARVFQDARYKPHTLTDGADKTCVLPRPDIAHLSDAVPADLLKECLGKLWLFLLQ